MNLLVRIIKYNKPVIINTFYQSQRLVHAYQYDERENYPKIYDRKPKKEKMNLFQQAKNGYLILKEECNLFMKEVKHALDDPEVFIQPNEIELMWRFNGDPKCLDPWLIVCDKDYNEGYSTCKLELTSEGKAIFSGNLDYRVPKDGKIHNAGYCALRTARFRKSFKRETNLNWEHYTHLVMRVRGDGRIYMINIGNKGFYDLRWNDLYNYVLFTRGGPYWQFVKIPFSKFFLSNHGRVQDSQFPLPLDNITSFGIIASDQIPGPFKLEIDYIGVEKDPVDPEVFAYEMYNANHILF